MATFDTAGISVSRGPFAAAAARCMPPGIAWCLDTLEALDGPLFAGERVDTERMAPVRLREYVAGRTAARRVLEELTGKAWPLPRARDHAPIWPAEVCGSLSHTRRYAVCVAAPRDRYGALGVDLEEDSRVGPELWDVLFSAGERRRIEATPTAIRLRFAALLFSAKEASYKLLSAAGLLSAPGFEPRDYETSPGETPDVVFSSPQAVRCPPLQGRCIHFDQHWLTLFFLPATQITAGTGPTPSAGHR